MQTLSEHTNLICTSGKKIEKLSFETTSGAFPYFVAALNRGVWVAVPEGRAVSQILVEDFGLDAEYVDTRIRAIFLNNSPVDDIETALVHDADKLTLSAALPGVAGITMERRNMIAAYRADITYAGGQAVNEQGVAMLRVKLLNFIAPEAGPNLLSFGVGLDADDWHGFVKGVDDGFASVVVAARLNGESLKPGDVARLGPPSQGSLRLVNVADKS